MVISGFLARVTRLPVPLVEIALGAAITLSSLTSVVLDPQTFFLLFLPPLLFLDGWRIPNDALVRDAPAILTLALGLVLFTVLGIGLFIHWMLPAMPLAVAFALAAVISPTDPIALSAIARRTPMPERLKHILQGESLLNDATGLVCMRFAVAAALTGTFSLPDALASFVWLALGGIAVGVGVTWLVARAAVWASENFGDESGAPILVTLLVPYGVYLLAERAHCSGILAAVAAGVTMSFADVWPWRAATRLRRTAVWDTVQLAANGSIFVLLGEQIPALVEAAPRTVLATGHTSPWWLALAVAAIVAALALLRFAWVAVSMRIAHLDARRRGEVLQPPRWRVVTALSLAGVRGAITLAAVLTLPVSLGGGAPFPARDLAIVLAAGVIVLSLLLATLCLPRVLQGLATGPERSGQAAEVRVRRAAAQAAVRAIEAQRASTAQGEPSGERHADIEARVIDTYRMRIARHSGGGRADARREDDVFERRLWLVGLRAERDETLRLGQELGLGEMTLRKLVRELDLQETRHAG